MIHVAKQDLQKKSKDELVDELYDSLVENDRLKRELRKYKNPNTPPSAHQHLKQSSQTAPKHSGKCGAPKGHTGSTRPQKEADETRPIIAKECPNCSSTDIPPDIQPKTVDVLRNVCMCNKCKLKFVARDGRTPVQGKFGINLIVLVIFLKFIVRGVLRKAAFFLDAGFALKLAPASVQAIIARAATAAETEYEQLKQKIREAMIVYADETSFSVLGKKWWVWVFRSDTDLLLVIRNSRGSSVVEEILGKCFAGTLVCDCWRAYDFLSFASIQRCWAHLLRKSKELYESVAGRHFHEKLSTLFDEIKRFNSKERTEKQRSRKYKQMTAKLRKLMAYYARYEECESVVKYVNFHLESWFTCIRLAGVEPTNNFAEQAIRETVLVRKIIGAFRSVTGTRVYEVLASLLATWQFQKLDVRKELERMLRANLC
jgi:transposase